MLVFQSPHFLHSVSTVGMFFIWSFSSSSGIGCFLRIWSITEYLRLKKVEQIGQDVFCPIGARGILDVEAVCGNNSAWGSEGLFLNIFSIHNLAAFPDMLCSFIKWSSRRILFENSSAHFSHLIAGDMWSAASTIPWLIAMCFLYCFLFLKVWLQLVQDFGSGLPESAIANLIANIWKNECHKYQKFA